MRRAMSELASMKRQMLNQLACDKTAVQPNPAFAATRPRATPVARVRRICRWARVSSQTQTAKAGFGWTAILSQAIWLGICLFMEANSDMARRILFAPIPHGAELDTL